jgi:hypothetical protein
MRSSRITALVLLGGAVVAGLVLEEADTPPPDPASTPAVVAGVAMPAANPESTLSSTWYCAGGTASDDGLADHVLLIGNPTDVARTATVTPLPGTVAPPPAEPPTEGGTTTTTTTADDTTTTTTVAETTTTTTAPPPAATQVEVPAQSRVEVRLGDLVRAPVASAVVEVDGGEIAVEHQITDLREGGGGRATAPCASTAARQWAFPWGITARGARELLVFMNPFPDDATVDVLLATDEGTREPQRLQNLVVRGRSSLGVSIEQDTRRDHVSALVKVSRGRLVVDRIQAFDGSEDAAYEGITLGLGAPTPAEVWMYPDGIVDEGVTEQVVVYNSSEEVAEVDVEVRLDDPDTNDVPEPFELTIAPNRFAIVNLHEPDPEASEDVPPRIPPGVGHSIIVRSLNGVAITSERVMTMSEPNETLGVSSTLGAPLAAPTWYFPGGGVTEDREEWITIFNASPDTVGHVDVTAVSGGESVALPNLQDIEIPAGGRRTMRLSNHVEDLEDLFVTVSADGPVVVERGLYAVAGRGSSLSMGIPLAVGVLVPDPLDG